MPSNKLLGKQMDIVERFKVQSKKRVINSMVALTFMVSALAISYYDLTFSFIGMRMDYFTLILKGVALIFIYFAYIHSLCPKCSKLSGTGWNITECKNCGEKLT